MKTVARSICVVVLAVLALAGTIPAGQAKGPTDVTVSGPGIVDVHLTFTEPIDDVDSGTLGDASQLYDMWSPGSLGPAPGLSADELGPRYVLSWSGDPHGDGNEDIVVQHAYPFAEGGAWVEFLPGQEMYGAPIASGWVQAPRLRTEMVELGAVQESPQAAVATEEAAAAPGDTGPSGQDSGSSGTSSDAVAPAGILLAIALIGGVLVVRHRGRHRAESSVVSR